MFSISNGCQLNFSSTSIDLSLRRDLNDDPITEQNVNDFHKQIDEMTTFVCDRLDVSQVLRIGFRMIFSIPMQSKETAVSEVKGKNIWKMGESFLNDIGRATTSEAMTIEFDLGESSYRIGILPMERPENVKLGNKKHSLRMADLPDKQRTKLGYSRDVAKVARLDQNEQWNVPHFVRVDIDSFVQDPDTINAADFSKKNHQTILDIAQKVERGYSKW